MGIDHLLLSPELVAALYPETLVVPGFNGLPKPATAVLKPDAFYPHLGENRRGIIFLVDYPDQVFLAADQLFFLEKILSACKYQTADIALINTARSPVVFEELKKQFRPAFIFLWGVTAGSIGLNSVFEDFAPAVHDSLQILSLPAPDLMNTNNPPGPEMKQRLWACLKKLFSL
jgi:hypothetical protein